MVHVAAGRQGRTDSVSCILGGFLRMDRFYSAYFYVRVCQGVPGLVLRSARRCFEKGTDLLSEATIFCGTIQAGPELFSRQPYSDEDGDILKAFLFVYHAFTPPSVPHRLFSSGQVHSLEGPPYPPPDDDR